ncbi:MAG: methionine aminotransferase [Bacteroidota bacterium]
MHSKLPDVGTTIFAVMSKMATDHNAINLSQGFPDFPVSEEIIALVYEGMKKGMNQYSPMPGLPMLREAIAKKLNATYQINTDPETEITITAGGTQALSAAITALVNPGDEVIIFDPAYDSYDPVVRLNQGVPIHLRLKPPSFSIDWDEVEAAITDRTKVIITNTPHNPSGAVLSHEDLQRLQNIVTKNNLYLISDEVYEHIIFDGLQHNSALSYPDLRARTVAIFSFGKTFHATGWKTGYMVAPAEMTVELRKMHQFNVFCSNTPMQYGIAKYLEDGDHYSYLGDFYQAKRDEFESYMAQTKFTPVPCHGTYFQLYSYENISDLHDIEMAEWVTKEYKVATIPSSVFYKNGEDIKYLRFCFAKSTETMEKAAELLCKI